MRTFAAALVACASADETSLMQERVSRSSALSTEGSVSRQESTNKLYETAVDMIKNGVTPDVLEFIDATDNTIENEVKEAILSEHRTDQLWIWSLCDRFNDTLAELEIRMGEIVEHDANRVAATAAHHDCRADEALKCASHRRCEAQLRERWRHVKREEDLMRQIHDSIYDEWCIHPPSKCELRLHEDMTTLTFTDACWLSQPFNWADHMEPSGRYPLLSVPGDVTVFRGWSYTRFHEYMEQKIVVECAWREYREKLEECSGLETEWENQIEPCDNLQKAMREHACEHAEENEEARREFGEQWDQLIADYELAVVTRSANEADRKKEWETLTIVQCLLRRIHANIDTAIRTPGSPCPTIDSHPEEVELALRDCHEVTQGCGPDSLTWHLCLQWCEIPVCPDLPPVEPPACTPEYVAREQAQFLTHIQTSYQASLTADSYVDPNPRSCGFSDDGDLNNIFNFETVLSTAGWAGCAPPLLCVNCEGMATILPVPNDDHQAEACHPHELYLNPGENNSHSFRCLDGTCASMTGRCNGVFNCADESDEMGCDADTFPIVPAYLGTSYTCPSDMHADVHFQCGNSRCIDKVGLCNGIDNCGDNSDEEHCSGSIQVTVEATSGRTISVETLQRDSGVFHDRNYNFNSLGHFAGKTFIKYSNDDKHTDHEHVMTKLRTVEPLTVFIVKLASHSLPWLSGQGFQQTSYSGVSFSGIRQSEGVGAVAIDDAARAAHRETGAVVLDRETRHKEWEREHLNIDPETENFAASSVWSKTFPAGTISIPGNGGGDGSFLIFVDRPGACEASSHQMVQGCLNNPRDLEPDCGLADVRCCSMDGLSCNSGNFPEIFTFLGGLTSQGTECQAGQCNGVADTWCHSAVSFTQAQEICAANGERLCTRVEIEDGVCCGTGCSHNAHLIWFDDTVHPITLPGYEAPNVGACRTADGEHGNYIRADHVANIAQCAAECDADPECHAIEFTGVTTGESNCELHRSPMPAATGHSNGLCYNRIMPVPIHNFGQTGGGNNCPAGDDVSEADCLAAAQSLLSSNQVQGRAHLVAGSWGWVPPGCSVQTHFTHGVNGDFAAHYNRGNGNNDGGYTKVCNMECQHLENMDVVAGTFGHYGRDHGNSPSAAACSAACTADAECTAWVWQPSRGNCWISNQLVVTFEADSDRTTGLRCN